jgi:alpha-1,2-glucosyltransferase
VNENSYISNRRWVVGQVLALLLIIVILLAEFRFMSDVRLLVDEGNNFRQITRYINGDFSMQPQMNVIPGYHALVALAMAVFHKTGIFTARLVSVGISILSVAVFYLLTLKLYKRPSLTKTFQYTFFPILFPFFALVYTDVLALLLVLLAFYLILWKRYTLAGFIGILSVLARTNNIAWLAFLYVIVYFENYHLNWQDFLKSWRKTWIYWVGFIAFLVFLILNKGIALTDKAAQPTGVFQTGNVFFLLFLFFLLFIPMNIANFPRIVRLVRDHKWTWVGITAIFLVYFFTFSSTHHYNLIDLDYYIHNKLLAAVTTNRGLKIAFFLPIAYSLFSLCVTTLHEKRFYWLYPFTVLSLVPFWLIEPRYSFVPLALFILFKKELSPWVEWITIGMYLVLSAVLLYFIHNRTIFI